MVTVLTAWALRLPELPAALSETGCTMLGTGCQSSRSGWKGAFLQVGALPTAALSLTGGQAVLCDLHPHTPCPAKQSCAASLSASVEGVDIPTPSSSSAKCFRPPPCLADESTPRRDRSQRRTRHVCLHQPPPTPATPPFNTTQYAAVARSSAGPVDGSEAPRAEDAATRRREEPHLVCCTVISVPKHWVGEELRDGRQTRSLPTSAGRPGPRPAPQGRRAATAAGGLLRSASPKPRSRAQRHPMTWHNAACGGY